QPGGGGSPARHRAPAARRRMTPPPAALLDSAAGTFLAIVVVLFLLFFWIALAFWAYRDARRRSDSVWLAVFALAVNVLPYVGLLLYVVLRPPRTMDEERALLLEEQALTEGPAEVISRPCPPCWRRWGWSPPSPCSPAPSRSCSRPRGSGAPSATSSPGWR